MKILSVPAELFLADGQTDIATLIVVFAIFRTPNKKEFSFNNLI